MRLSGKAVVVTGASMGIGEALVKAFLDEGAGVVLAARNPERLEAARVRLGSADRTRAVAGDVCRRQDLQRLLAAALERFGRLDVWINNAGFGLLDSLAQMSLAECRRMFDTNLFAVIEAMQLALPVLQRYRGTIINISSVAGHIPVPYMAAYSATKFALNAISKAARVELLPGGVHVMTVCPGYIQTDFALNAVKGSERMRLSRAARTGTSPERVARAVLRGYLGGKREVVVPWKDRFLIKAYQTAPAFIENGMRRMLRPADEVIAEAAAARKQ